MLRFAVLLAMVGAAIAPSAGAQATDKSGWWFRLDAGHTNATELQILVGKNAHSTDRGVWDKHEPIEFALGSEVDFPELYFEVMVPPDDKQAFFCIFFKDRGIRHFDLNAIRKRNPAAKSDGATLKTTDNDPQCKP